MDLSEDYSTNMRNFITDIFPFLAFVAIIIILLVQISDHKKDLRKIRQEAIARGLMERVITGEGKEIFCWKEIKQPLNETK